MSTDPEDWPSASSGALCRELDRSLRCLICSEFYNTPLSLLCGHSFCASCIRSNLQYQERTEEPKCPVCRAKYEAGDLKPAPQLRAAASAYNAARPVLLAAIKAFVEPDSIAQSEPQPDAIRIPALLKSSENGRLQLRHSSRRRQASAACDENSGSADVVGSATNGIARSSDSDGEEPAAKRSRRSRSVGTRKGYSNGSLLRKPQTALQDGCEFKNSSGRPASAAAALGGHCNNRQQVQTTVSSEVDVPPKCANSDSETDDFSDDDDPDFEMTSQPRSHSRSPEPPHPPLRPRLGQEKELPRGQVRCPNCAAMLPEKFINSHLDSCLTKNTTAATTGSCRVAGSMTNSSRAPDHAAHHNRRDTGGSVLPKSSTDSNRIRKLEPLKVPPKLAFTLISDKQMRDTCKKYGLPTSGKKEAMAERYKKLRLEVQTVNDAGQLDCSYANIARRVVRAENKAATVAFTPLARKATPASSAGQGDGFRDMIRATRERCAATKAALKTAEQDTGLLPPHDLLPAKGPGGTDLAASDAGPLRSRAVPASGPAEHLEARRSSDVAEKRPHFEATVAALEEHPEEHHISHAAEEPSQDGSCRQDTSGAIEQFVVCSQFPVGRGIHDAEDNISCSMSPSL